MSGQTRRPTGSLALVATLLMCGVGIGVPTNTARADDCLTGPNSPAPEGSHWYYHIDRATQRKCWYVRATDQPTQQVVAPATSDASPATPAPTLRKPAATNSPMSIIPGDSTPSLPRIKVLAVKSQDAPVSGATADQSVQQSAQIVSPASSIAEPPAAEPSPSSQTSDQGAAPAPATGPAWPDPVVTTVKTPNPTAAPSDARAESGQATADARPSDNVESTAQGSAPVAKAEMARSATSWPVAMFPVAVLGLVVAGFVSRIVMKISAGRRRRVVVDHRDCDWIDDRHQHELREDQFIHQPSSVADRLRRSAMWASLDSDPSRSADGRRGGVHDWDAASGITNKVSRRQRRRMDIDPSGSDRIGKLVDNLQSSRIAASDYRSGPPRQGDDSWPNDERRNDDTSQSSDEITERDEALKQLKRDLDQLLQSAKVAQHARRNGGGHGLRHRSTRSPPKSRTAANSPSGPVDRIKSY
jgi:hypothetical protein